MCLTPVSVCLTSVLPPFLPGNWHQNLNRTFNILHILRRVLKMMKNSAELIINFCFSQHRGKAVRT